MKKKQIKSNLKRRYSVVTATVAVLCLLILNIAQFIFMDDIFLLATQIDMKVLSLRIEQIDFSKGDYKATLSDYEANNNVYLEIYSNRDELIYTSESNKIVYDTDTNGKEDELKPRIMKILSRTERRDGSYYEIRQEIFASAQYLVYGCFFGEEMALEAYYPLDPIKDSAETASIALSILSLVVLTVIVILILYISKMFSLPIRQITRTTKKMANMNFDEKCQPYKVKELDELSTSINILSGSLKRALDDLQSENRQLESDIQAEKKQDKARRSFIANVSHELKTPISIIQGYAEGMKLGIGCDSTEEFCDIIIDEATRMNTLIVRLMEYMHYSVGAYKANSGEFNIKQLLAESLEGREIQLAEKGVELIFDVDEAYQGFGDTILVENIFSNYLSNALSHVDFDKRIEIRATDNGECYRISVYNTGKPIPGTDIENIWQSFYRADKSHSRAEGRFGLGLSFVSTMQDLMGQKYGVNNLPDGVEFWFDVKKWTNE